MGDRLDTLTGPLDALSPQQSSAAASRASRVVVRGVAGSGKTLALRARLRALLADGVSTEAIAVLVPDRARALGLAASLRAALPGAGEEIAVLTPTELAMRVLGERRPSPALRFGERVAMLCERLDALPLRHHDVGGRTTALVAELVGRIDRLKGAAVDLERFRAWADGLAADAPEVAREREFAAVYAVHERALRDADAQDAGDLVFAALARARRCATIGDGDGERRLGGYAHMLIDDVVELDAAAGALVQALGVPVLWCAGDPDAVTVRPPDAGPGAGVAEGGAAWLAALARTGELHELSRSVRCREGVWDAARALLGEASGATPPAASVGAAGSVALWRCADERSQAHTIAQAIATRRGVDGSSSSPTRSTSAASPVRITVLVPDVAREGQTIALALSERAIAHRIVGGAAFFARGEIRDLLAWLRLLLDPTDAAAVVRALARPPEELPAVDIARCTQIARRRKLDMVQAMVAALESPQVPPEARERIRGFLVLQRASVGLDEGRPDLYVHRLIERLGLRRRGLYSAGADVAERLRALAAFGELAGAFAARSPQASPRDFARSVTTVADVGLGGPEDAELGIGPVPSVAPSEAPAVEIRGIADPGADEADEVYVVGLHGELAVRAGLDPLAVPSALYRAASRARRRLVLSYSVRDDRGGVRAPAAELRELPRRLGMIWEERAPELFGPAETLEANYLQLRDELLAGTTRAAARLGELRFDTDLDVSHAVVRYLELLKLAALIARRDRGELSSLTDALHDINARIGQAVTAEQREILETSPFDASLLDAQRGARARARMIATREEPSLEAFLPLRGEGVVLSASDIDTYRACPLRYKFARIFRIPQEPTLHQRFGILVHQVLERYHGAHGEPDAATASAGPGLTDLLGLLDAGWRRGGFGDSDVERQLRGKAERALTRYHERFAAEGAEPVWFERSFTVPLGRHLLRGRVDRVDRLPDGDYELIDYKTGRPKSPAALADDVQLSLYAVGARDAWRLEASRQAYYYLLDDEKVAVPDDGERVEWVREVATEVGDGIRAQGFEPTPSFSVCGVCDYRLVCPAAER